MRLSLKFVLLIVLILFSFIIHILGLMNLIPLLITAPILFLSLLIFFYTVGNRKRFKGFKS
ncbi:hypothetical protein AS034_08885 [[Bacillus] enclensis]|uniref:Uncharacterized protein n=2 Tax=Rossellomorea TaxID=2837508 RepID=A0A0V8HI36_9BACI|nr:hypothetical protein [[Bacillus] enclensis]KSU62236.1 hypothetical protein AS034_08885 [[Bacillus] enclensis]MBH9966371.1 hypothetical protein [[Bacillus] enclensis]OAT83183.1 hypothetical protein A6P54_06215 [Bacillus sp. MKU004]SCC01288.1 hypothetical protein GA0061094_1843 [[Bacillus] enclensis]